MDTTQPKRYGARGDLRKSTESQRREMEKGSKRGRSRSEKKEKQKRNKKKEKQKVRKKEEKRNINKRWTLHNQKGKESGRETGI